ncbi:MAG: zf-HC2 domain-containing protein [Clostridiaceae bacterium]|nr:zf-HC2 domain-containing protein [Clostridiaceae bacterium]
MHVHEKDISLFLDNSLNPKKHKKLQEHFTVCKKCKDKLIKWQNFYSSLEQLEFNFELDGLEDKIMRKIKSHQFNKPVQNEFPRIPISALLYISFTVFILNLIFEPVLNAFGNFYRNTMAFMLDEGLEFINTAKWEAVDIIAMFKSLELTGLAACIILIAGGIYFTANRKSVRKA